MRKHAMFLALALVACGSSLTASDGEHFSELSRKLAACRQEAYEAKDAGASSARARMRYEDCKRREGIEGEQ